MNPTAALKAWLKVHPFYHQTTAPYIKGHTLTGTFRLWRCWEEYTLTTDEEVELMNSLAASELYKLRSL